MHPNKILIGAENHEGIRNLPWLTKGLKIGTFKIYECGLNSITKNILFLKKFH
jgi:hypothetical protein